MEGQTERARDPGRGVDARLVLPWIEQDADVALPRQEALQESQLGLDRELQHHGRRVGRSRQIVGVQDQPGDHGHVAQLAHGRLRPEGSQGQHEARPILTGTLQG